IMVVLRIRDLHELLPVMVAYVRRATRLQLGKLPNRQQKNKNPDARGFCQCGGGPASGEGKRELCKPAQSGEENCSRTERFRGSASRSRGTAKRMVRLDSAGESTSRLESCQRQPPHSV